jgi:hypothetical protein
MAVGWICRSPHFDKTDRANRPVSLDHLRRTDNE